MLARNALWPPGRMSVLAGFVEPGESAEHAVAREVYEETAIVVGQVRYLGSQPWPMPRSLMLGYQATAEGGQRIAVDEEEIGEARWFTRAELRAAIDAGELGVAPTSSIARRLIEYWYGDGAARRPGGLGWPAARGSASVSQLFHDFCRRTLFLTKADQFTRILSASELGEVARRVQIGGAGACSAAREAAGCGPTPGQPRRLG